jgi:hypothetical protein
MVISFVCSLHPLPLLSGDKQCQVNLSLQIPAPELRLRCIVLVALWKKQTCQTCMAPYLACSLPDWCIPPCVQLPTWPAHCQAGASRTVPRNIQSKSPLAVLGPAEVHVYKHSMYVSYKPRVNASPSLLPHVFFLEIQGRAHPPPAGNTQLSQVNLTAGGRRQSLTDEGRLTHPISGGARRLDQTKRGA